MITAALKQSYNSVGIYGRFSHLGEQKGDGSEGKGPAVLVGKIGLVALSPVQHFIVYTRDVQHQAHDQSQTWEVKQLVSDIKIQQRGEDVHMG